MTRYLDLGADLARRIAAGDPPPGSELPSVRALARERGATVSTVGRAYRHLAEHGVLVLAGRRRATVAPGGALAARQLVEATRVFRLAGSDDPALDLLLRHVGPAVRIVGARGSFGGLIALHRGEADGAAIHLRHRSGAENSPFGRALLRGRDPQLIHLWRREQGLIVAPGSGPRGVAGLRGLRVARREFGSGTRVLLERLLLAVDVDPDAVPGPAAGSHLEVALAVAAGMADAGLGVRSAAVEVGLDFVPVTWESFDVVLDGAALGSAVPLVAALHEPAVRAAIGALGGYDLTAAGEVSVLS